MKPEDVVSAYEKEGSLKKVARLFDVSEQKIRKILIDANAYESDTANKDSIWQTSRRKTPSEYVSADRKGQTMTDERLESRGGARENAGRKAAPKGSRRRSVTVTDYEYNYIQNWLKTHRESQDE